MDVHKEPHYAEGQGEPVLSLQHPPLDGMPWDEGRRAGSGAKPCWGVLVWAGVKP